MNFSITLDHIWNKHIARTQRNYKRDPRTVRPSSEHGGPDKPKQQHNTNAGSSIMVHQITSDVTSDEKRGSK